MDFTWIENFKEEQSFNGHVVHRLEARAEGKSRTDSDFEHSGYRSDELAYLNVTYIPSSVWEEQYTGALGFLRWASDFKGWTGVVDKPIESYIVTLSQKLDPWSDWLSRDEVSDLSLMEKCRLFENYFGQATKEYGEDYEATHEYHVDRPRVDYVCVAESMRRQGIGTALYDEAARVLAENYGLALHASTLQSDAAQGTWEHLNKIRDAVSPTTIPSPSGDTDKYVYDLRENLALQPA
jgi:GNAT superfamily N-acetyltransferase